MKNKKQFTLIELIIVIVVIGIFAAMAMPKFIGVVRNARLSAMINDKEVLEKTMLLYYQKYDKLPLLNEDQELIVINNDISLIKMVKAEEVISEDMKKIHTSLQETLKHYNDSEENLYRIDISKIKDSLSKKLKYGYKKEDKDFYVYSTKTNNVYYYNTIINGEGEIYHSEFNTKLKESELVDKKFSYNLEDNNSTINNKPIIELTTDLSNLTNNSLIEWTYSFVDEDKEPTKISFVLNDIEYDDFSKIPTQLEEGEYTIKLKMQDSKGLWSDEIIKSFIIKKNLNIKYSTLSLGSFYCMKIGIDDNLYTWGWNEYGQLGIGNTTNQIIPKLVTLPNSEKPISISSNWQHSITITNKGNLYSWGNNSFGKLGTGDTTNQTKPQLIILPNNEKPILIETGGNHSMTITDKGNLYAWGYNNRAQLGLGHTLNQSTPQKVILPNEEKPISVSLGDSHSMIITNNGNLYSWGYNSFGQLGLGHTIYRSTPQKVIIPNEEKVISVALGQSHSIVITDKGNLYVWGRNDYGQLGIGNTINQTKPRLVTLPNGEKSIFICVGQHETMAITNKGNLYSWGENNFGQLGLGYTIDQTTPQLVTLPNKEKPIFISLSAYNSMVITENNNVYAFGDNRFGQLGTGNTIKQTTPTKVTLP